MAESARVKAFRLSVAKQIPRFPNNKESLQILQTKALGGLLIDYANWAIRYIAPRPRAIVIEPSASNDPRWLSLSTEIESLLSKVRQGDDLTAHISLQPHTRGFTPAASGVGPLVDRWADKDMLLNVMGYHHLHFDAVPHNRMRSDDVLFAHVTRETFTVIGIFTHEVFYEISITPERHRLWQVFDEHSTRGAPPDSVVVPSIIATSGHPFRIVAMATEYARKIARIDPKLDDATYVAGLYRQAGISSPKKTKLEWRLHYLDLGLFDKRADAFFALHKGPN